MKKSITTIDGALEDACQVIKYLSQDIDGEHKNTVAVAKNIIEQYQKVLSQKKQNEINLLNLCNYIMYASESEIKQLLSEILVILTASGNRLYELNDFKSSPMWKELNYANNIFHTLLNSAKNE